MKRTAGILVCLLGGLACTAFAQQPDPPQQKFYKLEFVVKELENDKVINSRVHATTMSANVRDDSRNSSLRTGSRVPYANTPGIGMARQFNYFDIGVNIDCRDAKEVAPASLALYINADISSLVVPKEATDVPPVVRTTRWSSTVVVPIKKSVTIYSSDDLTGNRKMQLELTATPLQ